MDANWSIRSYNDGDENRIIELFNSIFKKSRTKDEWNWEFKQNPQGFKALVAVDKNRIAGHLGALHRNIKIGQKMAATSLEVDGMTHPDYGRQGIFVSLGRRLLSELKEEGFGIVIGFPNENALPGHRKLGAIELFTPPVMIRPVNFKNVSKRSFSNGFLRAIGKAAGKFMFSTVYRIKKAKVEDEVKIRNIPEFDERFDKFWNDASSSQSIILERNSRYLNWRYVRCPGNCYTIFVAEKRNQILGYIVVRVLEKFDLRNGAIVDILALPNQKNSAHALLLKAMEYLKSKEVDLIACLIPKWSSYYSVLKECGFVPIPKKMNPKEEPFIIYPISNDVELRLVKNPNSWHITWGDSDIV
ncbi:MAG: GNAT family N-acetyltransferase [Methanomassiliicoccales archaeon]|nr:MAG: GNAT family N-acetyltransferase [Methanomassiliicoccales archaeon]